MATIKLKFRPSTVRGKAGTLCYQLCHRQENRQITTDMRIIHLVGNTQPLSLPAFRARFPILHEKRDGSALGERPIRYLA